MIDKTLMAACTSTGYAIPVYSDASWYPVYAFAHEFGICHVVQAQNESEAYEIMIDEMTTIDSSEIIEAYGYWISDHDTCFILYDDRDSIRQTIGTFETLEEANACALTRIDADIDNHPLLEGYDYQSNCTGTGIVETGHYLNFASTADCILIFESED